REQGIYVLAQTSMPGVLVETGFISNPDEEKYLMTENGQEIVASAIYRGFREYKEEIDRRSNFSSVVRESPTTVEVTATQEAPGSTESAIDFPSDQIVFSIQISSSRNKIPAEPSSFKGHQNVRVLEDGRWYKYLAGQEESYTRVLERCLVVKKDFPDAFVVAIKNGRLIPLSEAIVEINR
ncbi:MAG: N-acetylmuramoyl-L-alanine amidase, partial [Bacteroidales bacterium]|nr:N-acetylmuramoyl-L-alanine amidase [Bacteroidales bacterium]